MKEDGVHVHVVVWERGGKEIRVDSFDSQTNLSSSLFIHPLLFLPFSLPLFTLFLISGIIIDEDMSTVLILEDDIDFQTNFKSKVERTLQEVNSHDPDWDLVLVSA